MNKTIGILAHVDAGKTTFSVQLLYHTKTIEERGRVDHKDAFLDSHEIEKERGITVFADQGEFTYRDSTYYIIDTPGHVDFSPEMEDPFIEFITERDETLFERYLETGYDKDVWLESCKRLIKENKLFPSSYGSALKDEGIADFLDQLELLTDTNYDIQGPFSGRVYKIRYDENGNRVTFIKVLGGTLHVRDEMSYGDIDHQISEKVTQLRSYNGEEFEQINEVQAGEVAAVIGLSTAEIGDGLGELKEKTSFQMMPTLKSKVIFDTSIPVKEMLTSFRMLEAEDPSLQVIWDEHFQGIYIHVMGKIQLEILEKIVKARFDYTVSFAAPEILYKEAVDTAVTGYGHFEPWKHYAEVHLKIDPTQRGSGITFENKCHANDLSVGNQNLVRQHVFERDHHGLLTGSALTDVKITLLTGRGHHQHTKGGDFREATFRALRQGLEQAKNVLIEPYYDFKIKVDLDHIGGVMSDIQRAHGTFSPVETIGDKAVLTGSVPVATFMDYQAIFVSFTHGKGVLTLRNGGYDRYHNSKEVINRIDYQKDADPEYSSSTILVAKAGLTNVIPWDQAKAAMHAL